MPELPEVETVKNALKLRLIGKKIVSVSIYWDNIIAMPSPQDFIINIKNQFINDIERRGKFIFFVLDDYILLSHLRMEGKYYIRSSDYKREKHNHIIFELDDNIKLVYDDTRKFGKMYLIEKDKINEIGPLKKLGCEPFSKDLTVSYLKEKFKDKYLPIKTVLLDQSIICGIGNIYADEILYLCNINPEAKTNTLNDKQIKNIINNAREVLTKAIDAGGTTIHTYKSVDGISGKFQNSLLVHGKDFQLCSKCGCKIIKTKVGGRGTYYCPHCQRGKGSEL